MNLLFRLTLQNLKLNRKRTVVTLIGIILSGALICGVSTLIASFQQLFVETAKVTDGSHHVSFYEVPYENLKYIENHVQTRTAMRSKDLGFARMGKVSDENRPYWMIKGYDNEAFEHFPITLKDGRFPAEAGEIAIAEDVFYLEGQDYDIGDTLDLGIGKRIDGEQILAQQPLSPTEKLQVEKTISYTITGIIERPSFLSYKLPGFAALAYFDSAALQPGDKLNVSVELKSPKDVYELAPEMAETAGASGVDYNDELLKWMGISQNENVNRMFNSVGLIIILLVVVGSVSVIYNAFAISVSERKKQFGMLSSVGATSSQTRRMVFYEALLLGVIAIPIGMLSGVAGIGVTLEAVNRIMPKSMLNSPVDLRLAVSAEAIWIAVGFVALTIFLSALIPALRAGRISPVEAIRLNTDIKIKRKKLRTFKLIRRLFGIEGELALKNLKRNRKRYRATVFSLFISIVLYVSFSSFMTYGFVSTDLYYQDVPYDFSVEKHGVSHAEKQNFYEQIAALSGVEDYAVVRRLFTQARLQKAQLGSYLVDHFIEGDDFAEYGFFSEDDGVKSGFPFGFNLISLGDAAFERYLSKLELEPQAFRDSDQLKGVLINQTKIQFPAMAEYEPLRIKSGKSVQLEEMIVEEEATRHAFSLEMAAVTGEYPLGVPYASLNDVNVIVSDTVFESLLQHFNAPSQSTADHSKMYLQISDGTDRLQLRKDIESLDAALHGRSRLVIRDTAAEKEELQSIKTVISIFLYGFVSLITLIGVTNIFNTISTNVALRRREFAMLKSVGLTPGGFNKMIRFESIFYGMKALLYGLPLSVAISVWMYNATANVFQFTFTLPWKEMSVCIVAVFIIVFVTMMHASARLKKENIIDALKQDNI